MSKWEDPESKISTVPPAAIVVPELPKTLDGWMQAIWDRLSTIDARLEDIEQEIRLLKANGDIRLGELQVLSRHVADAVRLRADVIDVTMRVGALERGSYQNGAHG